MAVANRLAGVDQTPPDSQVYVDGDVRRVFVGIDVDIGELLLARSLGADGVIAHHPIGSNARLGLPTGRPCPAYHQLRPRGGCGPPA